MKRKASRHPKIGRLLKALGFSIRHTAEIIGHLELLWHFAAEFAPQGDIGRFEDDQIEGAIHWYGKRGKLIQALTTSGWVDEHNLYRLVVHDWHDHCDDATKKQLERAKLPFLSVRENLSGQNPSRGGQRRTTTEHVPPALARALPEPEPLVVPSVTECSEDRADGRTDGGALNGTGLQIPAAATLQVVRELEAIAHSYPRSEYSRTMTNPAAIALDIAQALDGSDVTAFFRDVRDRIVNRNQSPLNPQGPRGPGLILFWAKEFSARRAS